MSGNFRGGKLFAGQLFAGQLWGPPPAPDEVSELTPGRGIRMRRWRPADLEPMPPIKRPRRRRREELILLAS